MYKEKGFGSNLESFQEHRGMSVYVRDPLKFHTHIHNNMSCVNNSFIEEVLNCEYKKVRNLPASSSGWFKATDNLSGTDIYGNPENDGEEWSKSWSNDGKEFLFLSGDLRDWLITATINVVEKKYENYQRRIRRSSVSNFPSQSKWYNRFENTEDPMISLKDYDISN